MSAEISPKLSLSYKKDANFNRERARELLAERQNYQKNMAAAFCNGGCDDVFSQLQQISDDVLQHSPLGGVAISVKDLFAVNGHVNCASSRLQFAPSAADATVVAQLKRLGAIICAKTHMTEFAYSGIGLNPHYDGLWQQINGVAHIVGGSSSGAAMSLLCGGAAAAIGSDTGGSVRIPAALCGLVGFKPSAYRVCKNGMMPLAKSFDSVGWLTHDVGDAVILNDLLALPAPLFTPVTTLRKQRFLLAHNVDYNEDCAEIATAFAGVCARLEKCGAIVTTLEIPHLQQLIDFLACAPLAAAEAFAWHEPLLARHATSYDPRVRKRILEGKDVDGATLTKWQIQRLKLAVQINDFLRTQQAILLMPTVPMLAPTVAQTLASDAQYFAINAALLRRTSMVNAFDGCAISLPMGKTNNLSMGVMLAAARGEDSRLLQIAKLLERQINYDD